MQMHVDSGDEDMAEVESGDDDNSASSDSHEDIDDVVGIALSDEIVDVKKSDLGPYTLRNGLSKVI